MALATVDQAVQHGVDRRTRRPCRPRAGRILRELALLAVLFGAYNAGRYYAARQSGSAFDNAELLLSLEAAFGLPDEAAVQAAVLQVPLVAQLANGYYAAVHFPLTIAFLLWLAVRRPGVYPRARWTLVALTGLGLAGHLVFPLAPPRMLPQHGLVDTGIRFGQSVYGPHSDGGLANQFAAMPSLHVGWAALVAVVMVLVTTSRWRWLWLAHPAITFYVVVVTANHYWLDGLVSIVLLACCLPLLERRK